MVKMKERGFTLIELLVVIAIIGLLAAVVLASLGSARQKGGDAAAKSALEGIRAQAELVASNAGNSYATVCTNPQVLKEIGSATSSVSGSTSVCQSEAADWAAASSLSSGAWCVDSNGASKFEGTLPTLSTPYACP